MVPAARSWKRRRSWKSAKAAPLRWAMKLYSVDSPASSFDSILIDGEHKWMLPGMDCPKCGVWISTGHEFPCIEPRREQQRFFIDGPMPLGWFKEVLPPSGIRRPDGSMPGPAEAFGRFTGR